MNAKKDISEELNSLAPSLQGLSKQPQQEVPEGYFDIFPTEMLGKVALSEPKVPGGYFDTFAKNLVNKIRSGEEETSPILESIGKDNVFTVPEGYFNELPAIIASRVQQPVKVVSMNFRSVARYAVAAVVTGIIGLGIFTFPKSGQEYDKEYRKIVQEGLSIARNADFDAVLQTVSGDEIESYLAESGVDVDAALAAVTIEKLSLPGSGDGVPGEKTLDDYLDELNVNDLN